MFSFMYHDHDIMAWQWEAKTYRADFAYVQIKTYLTLLIRVLLCLRAWREYGNITLLYGSFWSYLQSQSFGAVVYEAKIKTVYQHVDCAPSSPHSKYK